MDQSQKCPAGYGYLNVSDMPPGDTWPCPECGARVIPVMGKRNIVNGNHMLHAGHRKAQYKGEVLQGFYDG